MKKNILWLGLFLTLGFIVLNPVHAETLADQLSGRILLQVEQHGEAWYVNPADSVRYYMEDGAVAYQMMRNFGLGITDANLAAIPLVDDTTAANSVGNVCYSHSLANSVKGKILLQVEQHGEAWYVDPDTCYRIYMKDGDSAYTIMRFLSLGITDSDLATIPSSDDVSSSSGQSTTFISHYRVDVTTQAGGVWPTKDGGYLLNGQTDDLNPFFPPEGFFLKTDSNGKVVWSRLFQSFEYTTDPMATPYGSENGKEIIELSDGSIIAVGDLIGFTDDEYGENKENWYDVYITKFDKDGNHIWTKMIGDYGTDAVDQVFKTNDGGFMVSLKVDQLCNCSEPVDAYKNYVLVKYTADGEREWTKKTSFIKSSLYTDPFIIRPTSDGYIMIGQAESPEDDGFMSSSMSTMVKTDSNLNIIWEKDLEAVSQQYLNAVPNADGTFDLGYTTMRITAGDFQDVETTSDGGYITFGFFSDLITQGTYATFTISTDIDLAAAKFDSDGNLLWVKSLDSDIQKRENQLYAVKTTDGNFVIMSKDYVGSEHFDEYLDDPDKYLSFFYSSGAFLIKTDEDFNVIWSKEIGGVDYIDPQDLESTADGGVAISGYYITPEVATVRFGENIYYQDAILIKLDINGEASGGADWIEDYSTFTTADVSEYVVAHDLPVTFEDFAFQVDEAPTPAVPNHTATVANLVAPAASTGVAKGGSFLAEVPTPGTTTETKTWAQINYDDVIPVETTNAKSQAVDEDLLPGLNEVFNNEVKLRDNMGGFSLDYVFSRVVTEGDMAAVQAYLEDLGYTTYDSNTWQLTMMKVGYTLTMTFSIGNQNKGTLSVTF
ncbi:MAG: hypothetical protein WC702_01375 [Patescibacteria group bacterium]|jgi:hypothetical protein